MEISVRLSMEIDKDFENFSLEDDLLDVYAEFRKIIKNAVETNDISCFEFINKETGYPVENDVMYDDDD